MTLEQDIVKRSREIKTDGYAMSIGEVLSMYRDGDLDVHPEFQRIFRWDHDQRSRLIESILLGIPIPTIFVAQRDDGVWDVIDGVQRLSTVFQFVGMYQDADGEMLPPLVLKGTEYLEGLEGYTYEPDDRTDRSFSDVLRRDFKRSKLDFRIIKKESDPDSKYDLFQRLNSGSQLSAQEARNCLLVMLNPDFYRWMVDLAGDEAFLETVLLSEAKEDEGFRQELVLRFVLHQQFDQGPAELRKELGEFITDWVRGAVKEDAATLTDWQQRFERTFRLLRDCTGEDTFRRYDDARHRSLGPFSISAIEVITAGVGRHVDEWVVLGDEGQQTLAERVRDLWARQEFRTNSGSGISPRRRTPRLIHFGREYFAP